MHQVDDAFINRNARANRKNQDCDDKTPEVDFLAMAERKTFVSRFFRLVQTKQQQQLVTCVHDRVDAFRKHR